MDQEELKFVYELSKPWLRCFPDLRRSSSVGTCIITFLSGDLAGIVYNPMMVLHGEQYLELLRPLAGSQGLLGPHSGISQIYDKGSGMLLTIEGDSIDEMNRKRLAFSRWSVFIRGLGGFGGERGPSAQG